MTNKIKDYCNNSRDCECIFWSYGKVCDYCYETNCSALVKYKPPTNYEKIKKMSIDEVADKMAAEGICPYKKEPYDECKYGWHKQEQSCEDCIKEWLNQEVEE